MHGIFWVSTVHRMGYWSEYREVGFKLVLPIDCENKCVINDSNDFESTGLQQLLAVFISGTMSRSTELVLPLVTQPRKTHSEFSTWQIIVSFNLFGWTEGGGVPLKGPGLLYTEHKI